MYVFFYVYISTSINQYMGREGHHGDLKPPQPPWTRSLSLTQGLPASSTLPLSPPHTHLAEPRSPTAHEDRNPSIWGLEPHAHPSKNIEISCICSSVRPIGAKSYEVPSCQSPALWRSPVTVAAALLRAAAPAAYRPLGARRTLATPRSWRSRRLRSLDFKTNCSWRKNDIS